MVNLSNCTSISEACEKSGMTPLQLYKHLKRRGVKMDFPHTWFSQLVGGYDEKIEFDLEDEILK